MRRSELPRDEAASPPKKSTAPTMGPMYSKIIERVFNLDPLEEFTYLDGALTLGKPGHQLTYAEIADAFELSEDNARRAHALYCHAELALESFEIDTSVSISAMMENARAALREERDGAKVIAVADVEAYAKAHNVDEYREIALGRKRAKLMVSQVERLAKLWLERRRTLEAMSNRAR